MVGWPEALLVAKNELGLLILSAELRVLRTQLLCKTGMYS